MTSGVDDPLQRVPSPAKSTSPSALGALQGVASDSSLNRAFVTSPKDTGNFNISNYRSPDAIPGPDPFQLDDEDDDEVSSDVQGEEETGVESPEVDRVDSASPRVEISLNPSNDNPPAVSSPKKPFLNLPPAPISQLNLHSVLTPPEQDHNTIPLYVPALVKPSLFLPIPAVWNDICRLYIF